MWDPPDPLLSGEKSPEQLCQLSGEAIDLLPHGFIELDSDGTVLRVNEYEESRTGLNPDRLNGRNFFSELADCLIEHGIADRYSNLVALGAEGRFTETVRFGYRGVERYVRMVVLYSAEQARGFVLLRDLSEPGE